MMGNNVFLQIIIILILVLFNGVFALSEIALVAARKNRLKQQAEQGDTSAKRVLVLQETPNNFLATVQIGITTIGILSGALGSATLTNSLASLLVTLGLNSALAQQLSLMTVVLIITYLSLILGELVPKRIAMNNPEKLARLVSGPMTFLSKISAPLVKFLSWSTNIGLKIFRITESDLPEISEDEVRSMLLTGKELGVFEESEHEMVEGVFRLGDRRLEMVVTPRTELDWLDLQDPLEIWDQVIFTTQYNKLPVVDGDLDHVVGVVSTRDLLVRRLQKRDFPLGDFIKPTIFLPESMPALDALNAIKRSSSKMAMVIDEYGGLLGIVTLYDMMEAVIGEITNAEGEDLSAIMRSDGSWLVDGLMPIDELKTLLSVGDLSGEKEYGYQTLGGYIMAQMGDIPQTGGVLEVDGARFEVVDMDGRRVDRVLIYLSGNQSAPENTQDEQNSDSKNKPVSPNAKEQGE
jgi:putative hemolysin